MHTKPLPKVPRPAKEEASTSVHPQTNRSYQVADPTDRTLVTNANDLKLNAHALPSAFAANMNPKPSLHPDGVSASTLVSDTQNESALESLDHGYSRDAISGTFGTNIDLSKPRKYRLKKQSSSHNTHALQLDEEPSLAQVLEQERSAWTTGLPNNTSSPDFGLTVQDSGTWTAATLPETQASSDEEDNSTHATSVGHPIENDGANFIYAQSTSKSRGSTDTIRQKPRGRSKALHSPKRKSYFQEGSMNDTSKGVASAWHISQVDYEEDFGKASQAHLHDPEGASRASSTSRASTSSSIDINEFKPLPATPLTFKNTIKRFGQKLRHPDEFQLSGERETFTKPKRRKRGLRKSVSTWRIFNTTASELEDQRDHSASGSDYCDTTIKPSRNVQSRANADLLQKSILDKRKRKAEAIYAEQFGTSRKRQKPLDTIKDAPTDETTTADTATVRKRRSSGFATVRNIRSVLHRVNNGDSSLGSSDSVSTQSILTSSVQHTLNAEQTCPQSHDHAQKLDTDIDRSKKQSRSKLEKENQRLRSILRDQKVDSSVHRSQHHNQQVSDPKQGTDDKENTSTISLSNSSGLNRSMLDTIPSPTQTLYFLPNDAPPVPPLPLGLQPSRALNTISGNAKSIIDTATMKRRKPVCQSDSQVKLPRPLSIVLEGMEADSDQEQIHDTARTNQGGTEKRYACYDGVTDEENERNVGVASRVDWQWPEDVF